MFLESLLALALTQANSADRPLVAPANQWIVDYSQTACTLARRQGDAQSPIVAFNASLGREPGELVIMEAGEALYERLHGNVQVRIDQHQPLPIRARLEWRNRNLVIRLSPVPEDFLEQVAGGRQLSITKGSEAIVAFALPNADAAIAQLTRCNDDLLRSWGIDVAARRSLSKKPVARNFDWMINLQPRASTYVILEADISEAGRASGCRILVSSQNPRLDRTICERIQGSTRFEPALDAQGHPVAAQYVTRLRWVMDEEE